MLATIVWTLLVAGTPAAKLPSATAKEMTDAVIAVNKALGLESWNLPGDKPCLDRGGLEGTIKDVDAEETRQCAAPAVAHGFPGLGKDYALGIPIAQIGPVTVFTIGIGEAEGWGSYSCDPKRRCAPTKLAATSKQAKRLVERYRKACADPRTVWFPGRVGICADVPMTAPSPAAAQPTGRSPSPAAKPAPDGTPAKSPWPSKE